MLHCKTLVLSEAEGTNEPLTTATHRGTIKQCNNERLLGLNLQPEQHDTGPMHYTAQLSGNAVFEIYPTTSAENVTQNIRLGFYVDNLAIVLDKIAETGGIIYQPAKMSDWGYRAVVLDPEGRKVELIERSES